LDRETSGLIVVAKNDYSHRKLSEQFAERRVKKRYIALVHGFLEQDSGTIDAPISRDAVRRTRMTTRRSGGREAVTHYRVLQRFESDFGKFTLVEVKIDTGRTHQIRVHMASLGHLVVGDTLYGAPRELVPLGDRNRPGMASRSRTLVPKRASVQGDGDKVQQQIAALGRNFLHSAAIELTQPRTGALLSFERDLPPELKEFLATVHPDKG
jgi:23S rRNA pseudouridine1911/1915/1917 synthase